jgi:hypothetical protein
MRPTIEPETHKSKELALNNIRLLNLEREE